MDRTLAEVAIVPVAAVLDTSTPFTYSFRKEPLYVAARCVHVFRGRAAVPKARFLPGRLTAVAGAEDGFDVAIR
jgi:hypothetical protein